MLKEFLDGVVALAEKGQSPRLLKVPGEPEHNFRVAYADGRLIQMEAEPKPRGHVAGGISALAQVVEDRAGDDGANPIVVWYSRAGVVALLDDATRRDRVTLPIELHPQIQALAKLETAKPAWKQRDFVRLLRVDLDGCGTAPLVEVARRLKFRQGSQGEGIVQHGKASLGRSVEAELTGAGTIPESYELVVPVFAGALRQHCETIRCAIEIAPETETLQLIPFPGALEAAICQAEEWLGSRLDELLGEVDGVSVYYGQP